MFSLALFYTNRMNGSSVHSMLQAQGREQSKDLKSLSNTCKERSRFLNNILPTCEVKIMPFLICDRRNIYRQF